VYLLKRTIEEQVVIKREKPLTEPDLELVQIELNKTKQLACSFHAYATQLMAYWGNSVIQRMMEPKASFYQVIRIFQITKDGFCNFDEQPVR
jgi:hypothetical protein